MESNGKKIETHFLNVDLNVSTTSGSLKELIDAFSPALFEMGRECETYATFEVDGNFGQLSIDETILAFYNAVQALPPHARAIWDSADSRCFSIGIQGGDHPHQVNYVLSLETIARIASMKAYVGVTVYAPPED